MSFRVFSRKFSAGKQLRAIMDEQFTPDKLKAYEKPGKWIFFYFITVVINVYSCIYLRIVSFF